MSEQNQSNNEQLETVDQTDVNQPTSPQTSFLQFIKDALKNPTRFVDDSQMINAVWAAIIYMLVAAGAILTTFLVPFILLIFPGNMGTVIATQLLSGVQLPFQVLLTFAIIGTIFSIVIVLVVYAALKLFRAKNASFKRVFMQFANMTVLSSVFGILRIVCGFIGSVTEVLIFLNVMSILPVLTFMTVTLLDDNMYSEDTKVSKVYVSLVAMVLLVIVLVVLGMLAGNIANGSGLFRFRY